MGNKHPPTAKQELSRVRSRLAADLGAAQVTGRYHLLPRRIEDDYQLRRCEELGTGFNGAVFMAEAKASRKVVAVKPFKLHGLSKLERRSLRNEVELFLAMDHPHVARLKDVYEGERELTLVMERLVGGELFERIQRERAFSEHDAAETTRMMLLAINYLHGKGIVHRDIKPENFLYDSKEYTFLKLIDFGFSRFHRNTSKRMQLNCGTTAYMAPEVLDSSYDNKCDLWSLGVVVFILLMGYTPFPGESTDMVERSIKRGEIAIKDELWSGLSEPARDFVLSLLTADPKKRLSASEALAHSWISSIGGSADGVNAAMSTRTSSGESIIGDLTKFAAVSKFKRVCLSMMAWSLTNEERAQVRAAFLSMDVDKTGVIRLHELKQVLQEKVEIADAEVQRIFNALDSTCDDEIRYTEFLSAMVASRISMHEGLMLDAFQRLDVDGTGFITAANLRQVLGECYESSDVERLMGEADMSGDGTISFEEFVAYLRAAPESHVEAAELIIESEQRRQTLAAAKVPPTQPSSCGESAVTSDQGGGKSEGGKSKASTAVWNPARTMTKSVTCALS